MSAVHRTSDGDCSSVREQNRSGEQCPTAEPSLASGSPVPSLSPSRRSSLVSIARDHLRRGSLSEAVSEDGLEQRREVRRESRSELQKESRAESGPESRAEAGSNSRVESRTETIADSRTEPPAKSKIGSVSEVAFVTLSDNLHETRSQSESKSPPKVNTEFQQLLPSDLPTKKHSDSPTEIQHLTESRPVARPETRPEIRISRVATSGESLTASRRRKTGAHRRRERVGDMASRPGPLDLTRATTTTSSASTVAAVLATDSDPDIAFFQQKLVSVTAPRVVGATLKRPEGAATGPRSPGVRSPPWAPSRASVFQFGDEARGGVASPSPGPSPGPDTVSASFFFEPDEDPPTALRSERDFIDYLLSLPSPDQSVERLRPPASSSQSRKSAAAVGPPKTGMEHLDHLCRLMEQLGDLREQNSVLQRRIHYLEELKGLQEAQWNMNSEAAPPGGTIRKRHGSEESLLKSRGGETSAGKSKRNLKLKRALYLQQRERSKSVGHDVPEVSPVTPPSPPPPPRPARTTVAALPPALPPHRNKELATGKAKISKWTKVKEAFRWEKAQEIRDDSGTAGESGGRTRHGESTVSAPLPESKSQDSGLEVDRSRLLQIPGSRSRESHMSPSPVDSMLSGEPDSGCDVTLAELRYRMCYVVCIDVTELVPAAYRCAMPLSLTGTAKNINIFSSDHIVFNGLIPKRPLVKSL